MINVWFDLCGNRLIFSPIGDESRCLKNHFGERESCGWKQAEKISDMGNSDIKPYQYACIGETGEKILSKMVIQVSRDCKYSNFIDRLPRTSGPASYNISDYFFLIWALSLRKNKLSVCCVISLNTNFFKILYVDGVAFKKTSKLIFTIRFSLQNVYRRNLWYFWYKSGTFQKEYYKNDVLSAYILLKFVLHREISPSHLTCSPFFQ